MKLDSPVHACAGGIARLDLWHLNRRLNPPRWRSWSLFSSAARSPPLYPAFWIDEDDDFWWIGTHLFLRARLSLFPHDDRQIRTKMELTTADCGDSITTLENSFKRADPKNCLSSSVLDRSLSDSSLPCCCVPIPRRSTPDAGEVFQSERYGQEVQLPPCYLPAD